MSTTMKVIFLLGCMVCPAMSTFGQWPNMCSRTVSYVRYEDIVTTVSRIERTQVPCDRSRGGYLWGNSDLCTSYSVKYHRQRRTQSRLAYKTEYYCCDESEGRGRGKRDWGSGGSSLWCSPGLPSCNPPCVNGLCVGFDTCICDPLYTGSTCSDPLCDPPCGDDNGFCIARNTCFCYTGHIRQTCTTEEEDDHDSCQDDNGGCAHMCREVNDHVQCSCRDGYILGDDSKFCIDIDECTNHNGECSQVCTNLPGTYKCSCRSGYLLQGDEKTCRDINECDTTNGNCSHVCTNLNGGYICSCRVGFTLGEDGLTCHDINECDDVISGCQHTCVNTIGSYRCECRAGFELEEDGHSCRDIDVNECGPNNGGCSHICTNLHEAFQCSCRDGYHLSTDQITCTDFNECFVDNGGCNQICKNEVGSFSCSCRSGFVLGANGKTCEDFNECEMLNGGCSQLCYNTDGSFYCSCNAGYVLASDDKLCWDINECLHGNGDCDHYCMNRMGSFDCTCRSGYNLDDDLKSCTELKQQMTTKPTPEAVGREGNVGMSGPPTVLFGAIGAGIVIAVIFIIFVALVCRRRYSTGKNDSTKHLDEAATAKNNEREVNIYAIFKDNRLMDEADSLKKDTSVDIIIKEPMYEEIPIATTKNQLWDGKGDKNTNNKDV
ncbi:uncharacterized protein LOC144443752 [Glandiceps talaboti]